MFANESLHQLAALGVVNDHHLDAAGSNVLFGAAEGAVLADDNFPDAIEQGCAAAHVTGRQRGIENGPAIIGRLEPAGIFETIHFRVEHGASLLHPPIVTASDNDPIDNEDGADWNASFSQS